MTSLSLIEYCEDRPTGVLISLISQRLQGEQNKQIMIVEGRDDHLVLQKLFKNFTENPIIAKGKSKVLEIYNHFHNNLQRLLFILDRDFDFILNKYEARDKILYTDTHDFDSMIFFSEAFDDLILEFGEAKKIGTKLPQIKESIFKIGLELGLMRLISENKGYDIDFKLIDYNIYIDNHNGLMNLKRNHLIMNLCHDYDISPSKKAEFQKELSTFLKNPLFSREEICTGHDLHKVFFILLTQSIGNNEARKLTPKLIGNCFHLAYNVDYFKTTNLYQRIFSIICN